PGTGLQRIKLAAGKLPRPDAVEYRAVQLVIALTVLLLQITDLECVLKPYVRTCNETALPGITPVNRRQLEKITAQHNLQPAKRPVAAANRPGNLFDHIQAEIMKHANLINDQYVGLDDQLRALLADFVEKHSIQAIAYAHARPGMNSRAVQVRGCQAGRSSNSHRLALSPCPPDEFI